MKLLDKVYNWAIEKSKSEHAVWWLSLISACEGVFSPIFPDPMLAIMVSVNRAKALFYTIACSISSVSGGIIGYIIGYALFDSVGKSILEFYGHTEIMNALDIRSRVLVFVLIMIKTFMPIPYKIVAIFCGLLKIDLITFVFASFCSRFTRFFIVAFLSKKCGSYFLNLLEKNKLLRATILIASIVIAIVLIFKI